MFYIMTQQGHKIIELSDQRPTQEQLEKLAQECHVDLYVIEGEHSGITYTRTMVSPPPDRRWHQYEDYADGDKPDQRCRLSPDDADRAVHDDEELSRELQDQRFEDERMYKEMVLRGLGRP